MSGHLSSEQLDAVWSGRADEAAVAHAKACAMCSDELALLRSVFGDLRMTTAAVAEQQMQAAAVRPARRVPRMAWAAAMLALFVSVAAPLAVHRKPVVLIDRVTMNPALTMSDEALMESVRNDLDASVPESLQPLASTSSSNATSTTTASTTTRKER